VSDSPDHLIELGDLSDLRNGAMRCFAHIGEHGLIVCRLDDTLYAVEDNCSHRDAKLSEGRLRGGLLTCPQHGAQFDPRTGAHQGPPAAQPIATYAVAESDEGAVVVVPD
jgi:3-phenylpropionate/trans-cinnamate dioxygenase ferredoxin component